MDLGYFDRPNKYKSITWDDIDLTQLKKWIHKNVILLHGDSNNFINLLMSLIRKRPRFVFLFIKSGFLWIAVIQFLFDLPIPNTNGPPVKMALDSTHF